MELTSRDFEARLQRSRKRVQWRGFEMDQAYCINCGAPGPLCFPATTYFVWQCDACAERYPLPDNCIRFTPEEEDHLLIRNGG